jgi:cytoskeletal protein CcmA (bactofilin family)
MRNQFSLRNGAILLITLLVLLGSVPGLAAAERTQAGGTIVVEAGETVRGDLTAMGGSVVIRGTVTGDVQAFAGSVDIEGTVGGNVEGAAGSITVGESAVIDGDLSAGAGSITIDGTVRGTVEAGAETITLGPNAEIQGDLRYGGELTRREGATVGGSVIQEESTGGVSLLPSIPSWTFSVYGFLVNLVFAAALLLVFPRFTAGMGERTSASPGRTAGAGLLAMIGIPILLVLIALTIVGIPMSIMGAFVYGLTIWVAYVLGRFVVGAWILSYTDVGGRWLALLLGFALIAVLTFLPVVGGLFDLVALLLGMGALMLGLRKAYGSRGEPDEEDESRENDGGVTEDTGSPA